MANPSRGGDAKPWVLHCTRVVRHDRQVTEVHKYDLCNFGLADSARFFIGRLPFFGK
jgi:hypothetical protein